MEQTLTYVTVKHDTLISSLDMKLEQLKTNFIEQNYQLTKGQKDFTLKI